MLSTVIDTFCDGDERCGPRPPGAGPAPCRKARRATGRCDRPGHFGPDCRKTAFLGSGARCAARRPALQDSPKHGLALGRFGRHGAVDGLVSDTAVYSNILRTCVRIRRRGRNCRCRCPAAGPRVAAIAAVLRARSSSRRGAVWVHIFKGIYVPSRRSALAFVSSNEHPTECQRGRGRRSAAGRSRSLPVAAGCRQGAASHHAARLGPVSASLHGRSLRRRALMDSAGTRKQLLRVPADARQVAAPSASPFGNSCSARSAA